MTEGRNRVLAFLRGVVAFDTETTRRYGMADSAQVAEVVVMLGAHLFAPLFEAQGN
jgi:hypothetical protein